MWRVLSAKQEADKHTQTAAKLLSKYSGIVQKPIVLSVNHTAMLCNDQLETDKAVHTTAVT